MTTHHSHTPAICEACDPYPEFDSPEMPAPGYDAQTRRIGVALTTDQFEDAKLGRALREFVEYDGSISRHVDIEGGIGPIQVELFDSNEGSYRAIGPTLLTALTAARRELDDRS